MMNAPITPVRVNPLFVHPEERRVSLDGTWAFRLDPTDAGVDEAWYAHPELIIEPIAVPGCWQGQGFGHDGTDTIWDFQLQARVFRATYQGTGWYATTFAAPADFAGARCWLNFGGVHPSAEVWLNGARLGENTLPFVPFAFEVTGLLRPDGNTLVVRVHEQHRAFGLAFNWQGNWSGLYRGVELTATGACRLAQVALHPDLATATLRVAARLDGLPPTAPGKGHHAGTLALRLTVAGQELTVPVTGEDVTCTLPLTSVRPWSPDDPHLYRVDVALLDGETVLDAQCERAGFVQFATAGKQFLINGDPYYLRGSGDFISCPETGCPDTDRERWRKKLRALRDYGYNYVRCQSYVYPPEYFDAADEVGLLVQSEMGVLGAWGGSNPWHVYQWPKPTPDNYPILKRQWDAIVARDVNHPSANIYCMSNEYGAGTDFPRIAWQCYHDTKALKPTAVVLWTDGGYHPDLPGDIVNAEADTDAQCAQPLVQHEFRWWSAFPDVRRADKYAGAIRPYAVEIARAAAARQGQLHLLPAFADASLHLQLLEAKVKMEACRRDHPTLAGICHFDAMDANPSPQGIIDEFYEEKLASAACWRQTNGDTVLLAGLNSDDRVLRAGDAFRCALSVSDFAHPPLAAPHIAWQLRAGDAVLAEGRLDYDHQPFRTCPAGEVACTLPETATPRALTLEATLRDGARTVHNAWKLWLFPAAASLPSGAVRYGDLATGWTAQWSEVPTVTDLDGPGITVVLADRLDAALLAYLRRGGRALLAASEGLVRPHAPNFGYVKYFYTPPANYSPYEDGQNGTLLRDHPMLGALPHDGYADLHFFRLIDTAPPFDLAPLDLAADDPVLRVIHRYPVCRPLGYLLERTCGDGRLLFCGLALDPAWPEARYLLAQLCAYAAGDAFAPAPALSATAITRLIDSTALCAPGHTTFTAPDAAR